MNANPTYWVFTRAFNHNWQLSKILSIEQTQCGCSSTNPDCTEWRHYGFSAYERRNLLIIFRKVTLSRCIECDRHICQIPTPSCCTKTPRKRRIADPSLFFFSKLFLVFSFRPYVLCFLCIHWIHLAFVESKSLHPPTCTHIRRCLRLELLKEAQLNMLSSRLILFTQMQFTDITHICSIWPNRLGFLGFSVLLHL